jgi:site-specific DNA-methyltransferase (adenine-specific)
MPLESAEVACACESRLSWPVPLHLTNRSFTGEAMPIFNDHFQNYKRYGIPKAQLVIADIPYNIGKNAYGSNPAWYIDGDNANGESELAGKEFFDTDKDFRLAEFMHFCSKMMRKERKERNTSPCMIVFCEFWQQFKLKELATQYGINGCINLVFRKNFSAQALKANMRIVGNAEYALLLYRDKLPKFNNDGKMIFNIIDWERDAKDEIYEKIHPTQKPVKLLEKLIKIFTDPGDVVIDPVAGSGSTLIAAENTGRKGIGFEIKKDFYAKASAWIEKNKTIKDEIKAAGYSKILMQLQNPNQEILF